MDYDLWFRARLASGTNCYFQKGKHDFTEIRFEPFVPTWYLMESRSSLLNPGDFFIFDELCFHVSDDWKLSRCKNRKLRIFEMRVTRSLGRNKIPKDLHRMILDYHCSNWGERNFFCTYKVSETASLENGSFTMRQRNILEDLRKSGPRSLVFGSSTSAFETFLLLIKHKMEQDYDEDED